MIVHLHWTEEPELRNENETWAAARELSVGERELPKLGGQEDLPNYKGSDAEYEELETEHVLME